MLFSRDNNKQMLALKQENQDLEESVSRLKEECANYKQTISAFYGVKESYADEVETVKKHLASQLTSLNQQLEQEKKSVNRKVNKALADIGVKQFAAEEISQTQNDSDSIYSRYTSLSGAEKTKFFQANEAVLTKLAGFQKI